MRGRLGELAPPRLRQELLPRQRAALQHVVLEHDLELRGERLGGRGRLERLLVDDKRVGQHLKVRAARRKRRGDGMFASN